MFKDFASYLTTLKQRLEEYFARAEQEENEKIASFFSSLKKSLLGKQEAVAAWENEITIGEKKYDREKERLEVLLGDLQKILTEGLPNHLKSSQPEAGGETGDASLYKRKKHNINYKLNNLKRTLMQKIKENNDAINDENRGYKNREAELLRRQNIDIQRSVSNNIKEYGDLEKKLLDINDGKSIIETKKKIKKIRIAGLKEQMNIKNKYAQLLYQNSLEYAKFYEKMMLNHELINEEFGLKIKALEAEKQEIELLEKSDAAVAELEWKKRLLDWEKENELSRLKALSKISEQIIDLKKQIAANDAEKIKYVREKINATEKEIYDFDRDQLRIYLKEKYFSEQLNAVTALFFEQLLLLLEAAFRQLKNIIEESYRQRYRLLMKISEYFLTRNKEKSLHSGREYRGIIEKGERLISEARARQEKARDKFFNGLHQHFAAAAAAINEIMKAAAEWLAAEETAFAELGASCDGILAEEYRKSVAANEEIARGKLDKFARVFESIEAEAEANNRHYEEAARKIEAEFLIRCETIDDQIKKLRAETKEKIARIQKEYVLFKKKSRQRQNVHRNNYNQNILQHEKTLYKQYREQLAENELERERKIKTL